MHGRRAYYNINRHINYTNYCVLRCKFCSFYRPFPKRHDGAQTAGHEASPVASDLRVRRQDRPETGPPPPVGAACDRDPNRAREPAAGADGGYEYSLDEIVDLAAEAAQRGATEVHIVGGLHPKLPFAFYTDMCRAIKQRCPDLHIKAFTAIEIVHFARISRPRLSIEEVLIALREAGLGSLPGGGAEIFDDRVHDEAFTAKVGEKHWFDVHRAAHDLGIPSNATMLYGHVETIEERVTHLVKLREHQDESLMRMQKAKCGIQNAKTRAESAGRRPEHAADDRLALSAPGSETAALASADAATTFGHLPAAFQCCIPLSFIPEGSEFAHLPGPTGLDDLKTLAIARLMLDNFPHIKAFWPMQSSKLSQVALNWGVDDFDGTVVWYDITKREGRGTNRQELTIEQIQWLIREAGCQPVERDTLYRPVIRDAAGRVIARGDTAA
ncbi:MAG: radical SAM protein [Phycisphaerae bacterium]